MPLINFSGIASGIDSNALIDAILAAERQVKVDPQEKKIKELEDTNTALSSFKSKLSTLQDILEDFSSVGGGPLVKEAVSNDSTYVTATAANSAANGSYTISNIQSLAKSATYSTGGTLTYSSASDKIAPGMGSTSYNVTITIGEGTGNTQTFNIAVNDQTSLSDFVTSFNSSTSRAVATVVNAGSTSSPNYKVLMTTNETGLSRGKIDVVVDPVIQANGGGSTVWDTPEIDQATVARFQMSGIVSGTDYIERDSNQVSNLIPGVTFTLNKTSDPTDSFTITVQDNVSGTTAKVQEFIDAYNDLIAFIHENNSIESNEVGSNIVNTFGPLATSRIDDNFVVSLRADMTASAYLNTGNSSSATNLIRIFSDIGITTDSGPYNPDTKKGGGTLKFVSSSTNPDDYPFEKALTTEPQSVNQILKNLGDRAGRVEFTDPTSGDKRPGTVQLYVRANGIIETSVQSNKDLIKDINSRIARAEASLTQQEQSLRARFARLESLLGKMQNTQASLSSALSSLPSTRR